MNNKILIKMALVKSKSFFHLIFRNNMAKKALINKHKNEQKFNVCEYTRCEKFGRTHSVLRKFKLCLYMLQRISI